MALRAQQPVIYAATMESMSAGKPSDLLSLAERLEAQSASVRVLTTATAHAGRASVAGHSTITVASHSAVTARPAAILARPTTVAISMAAAAHGLAARRRHRPHWHPRPWRRPYTYGQREQRRDRHLLSGRTSHERPSALRRKGHLRARQRRRRGEARVGRPR